MDATQLKARMRAFALDVIALVEILPRSMTTEVLGKQLLRSATSVGANYRAACRARSKPDFLAKMGILEEEADECLYWMELLRDYRRITPERYAPLAKEADELLAITVASINTARLSRTNIAPGARASQAQSVNK